MRKKVQYSLAAALMAAFVFVNVGNSTANTDAVPDLQKAKEIQDVMQNKCLNCHSVGYDLPFYSAIPGIKAIIERDFRDGIRAMDITAEFSATDLKKPFNEAALAKMEWVILNNSMPPMKFAMVHWGSTLSSEEKENILLWVKETRKKHYVTGDPSRPLANEPLQPVSVVPYDAEKAKLGEALFNDKRLSTDSTIACATCHNFEKGGTDQQQFSEGVRAQFGDINAPTVFNAVYNMAQFWDGRAKDLQEQAGGPPLNPIEMGSKDWNEIIARLAQDETLSQAFQKEYPSGWTGENITHAIAEYEKLLITPDSRFDQWLHGDTKALSADELKGYELFKLYRCSSCHVGQGVGGQSYEYMNLKAEYFEQPGRQALNSDKGRMNFTNRERDLHKFKVPLLRNVEYTWPYMHDGSVATLDEAVRIMGEYLSGLSVPEKDRALIVAFLRTLTGKLKGEDLKGTTAAK